MLRSILGTLFLITLFTVSAHADTFEFLSFTPPTGWTKQNSNDGVVYKRSTGIGAISFYTSYPTTGSAAAEFEKMWQTRLGSIVPGGAPVPKLDREADYAVAIGGQNVNAKDATVSFSMVIFVGRGRALGVVMVFAGDEVEREVTGFLNTVSIASVADANKAGSSGAVEVDFDVPAGYTPIRDGNTVVLKPTNTNRATPCFYGLSPSRPSSGNLEADARAALLEPLPGWQIKSDHHNAMRGVAGAGWPYYWLRTDVQRLNGPSYEYYTAMAMAFSNGSGRVSLFWGFGSTGPCTVDDATFLRLFFSLRPRGGTSDGGKALGRELQGLWRDTQNSGMAQYQFASNGRYEYGLGTSTTFGNLETRTGSVHDGRWELRGSDLTLTGGSRSGKYRVRIYDEFMGGVWRRAMSLLNESGLDVHYMRIGQ